MTNEEKEKVIARIKDKKIQKGTKKILLLVKSVDEYLEDLENLTKDFNYNNVLEVLFDDEKMDTVFKASEKVAIINFLLDKDE